MTFARNMLLQKEQNARKHAGRRHNPTMLPIRILYLCAAAHLHLSPDNARLAVQNFGV
jgi:hypothetical protein